MDGFIEAQRVDTPNCDQLFNSRQVFWGQQRHTTVNKTDIQADRQYALYSTHKQNAYYGNPLYAH